MTPTEGAILHEHARQFFSRNVDVESRAETFFAHMEVLFKTVKVIKIPHVAKPVCNHYSQTETHNELNAN